MSFPVNPPSTNDHVLKSALNEPSAPSIDAFGRTLTTLRLSVTDRCNFRCSYCMPQKTEGNDYKFFSNQNRLTMGETIRLVKILKKMGMRKIRLTGGEPLLYRPLTKLIRELRQIEGILEIALTTNGSLLPQHAQALADAGLHRITVSLDTLDSGLFRKVRGRNRLGHVLAGIHAAEKAGFRSIKINTVVIKGTNDHEVLSIIDHFRNTPHIPRFIECMDTGSHLVWNPDLVVPNSQIIALIQKRYPLELISSSTCGETSSRYRFIDGKGEIGFISAVSQPFCHACNRLRLSSEGMLYTCLFAGEGTDLRQTMRHGVSDEKLHALIRRVWCSRADKYSENRSLFQALKETIEKVEMHRIGG